MTTRLTTTNEHDHHNGPHGHDHTHMPVGDTSGPRLLITLALNFIIPVAQVIGGLAGVVEQHRLFLPRGGARPAGEQNRSADRPHSTRTDAPVRHRPPVLQFETVDCGRGALLCEMGCNADGTCVEKP
jgi:hypothetical protein